MRQTSETRNGNSEVPGDFIPVERLLASTRKRFQQVSSLPDFELYEPKQGHPHWGLLMQEATALANELQPHLQQPESGFSKLTRRVESYRTALGNFLINKDRAKEDRHDFLPLYFIWALLNNCDFNCTYCDDHIGSAYPDLDSKGRLDTEQSIELLRVMRTRTPSVYLTGGEPTLRPDLPEITRAARELKYYPIITNTNGARLHSLLQKPEWSGWLADTDMIVVSLDALDIDTLKQMWATGEAEAENVLCNLLLLRKLRDEFDFKLLVNTVIQPGRSEEAGAVLDLANDLDITFCPVPQNAEAGIAPGLLDDPQYLELVDKILARKREGHSIVGSEAMNDRMLHAKPFDCKNTLKPAINAKGELRWPCSAEVNIPQRQIPVLDFEDVDSLYAHASSLVDPTNLHGSCADQCGGNCNRAQHYSTDAYNRGLSRPLGLVSEILDFLRL